MSGQRKIAYLFTACFILLLVVSTGFASAVIHRLAQLQSQARVLHQHSLALTQAGPEMLADVSQMQALVARALLDRPASRPSQAGASLQALDADFRRNLALISSESTEIRSAGDQVSRELDAWHATHLRMLDLLHKGHGSQALALATTTGVPDHMRLNAALAALMQKVQTHTAALSREAADSENAAIREAWWTLGYFTLFSLLCGALALRRTGLIMKDDARLVAQLRENEQRLQMALAGGNQGTWDLDVATGKLSFDDQWGGLLGYAESRDRPATKDQWVARIFAEDRERVLKAIHDHIQGLTPEYRAEYRIRDHADELKWVAGHGKAMERDSKGIATRVLGITQDITQRKLSEEKIWKLAHTDILTGLPNRVLLYDRLAQTVSYARRHGTMFALFFLDLDGFKEVNDRHGHDVGDELLKQVATRLSDVTRSEDTLARVGGDEFVFVLSGIHKREDACTIADNVLTLLAEEFIINECRCSIGGSIGIALFPDDSEDLDTLLSRADNAMYQAKARGKNNYQFCQPAAGGAAAA